MPVDSVQVSWGRKKKKDESTCQVVISSATIISSLSTRAVNEIETICKNSFSKRTSDMIMMAAPERNPKHDHIKISP